MSYDKLSKEQRAHSTPTEALLQECSTPSLVVHADDATPTVSEHKQTQQAADVAASAHLSYDRPHLDDRFELLEPIGEGAMAYVWKVRDKSIDQILALKLLRKEWIENAEVADLFQQEARLAMTLDHPHIAAVYEPGKDLNGRPYILMDYIQGETLQQLMARVGPLDEVRAMEILHQICQALAHAHMNGIVHRDIKPSNIMIDTSKTDADYIKVVDFGIARSMHHEVNRTQLLTKPLGDFATPTYMSPEQCLGQEVTAQSDIYSLGCVLHEMISGKPPFTEKNQVRLIMQHLNEEPNYRKFSAKVASHLYIMMAKDPQYRAPTVNEFLYASPFDSEKYKWNADNEKLINTVAVVLLITFNLIMASRNIENLLVLTISAFVMTASCLFWSLRDAMRITKDHAIARIISIQLGAAAGLTPVLLNLFLPQQLHIPILAAGYALGIYLANSASGYRIIKALLSSAFCDRMREFHNPEMKVRVHDTTLAIISRIIWALIATVALIEIVFACPAIYYSGGDPTYNRTVFQISLGLIGIPLLTPGLIYLSSKKSTLVKQHILRPLVGPCMAIMAISLPLLLPIAIYNHPAILPGFARLGLALRDYRHAGMLNKDAYKILKTLASRDVTHSLLPLEKVETAYANYQMARYATNKNDFLIYFDRFVNLAKQSAPLMDVYIPGTGATITLDRAIMELRGGGGYQLDRSRVDELYALLKNLKGTLTDMETTDFYKPPIIIGPRMLERIE